MMYELSLKHVHVVPNLALAKKIVYNYAPYLHKESIQVRSASCKKYWI